MKTSSIHTAILAGAQATLTAGQFGASAGPRSACEDIPRPQMPGTDIVAWSAAERFNVSGTLADPAGTLIASLNICNINVSLTHPGVGDKVGFEIWLPLGDWNGRFMATGGSVWIAGFGGVSGLGVAVDKGFAAGITDGGVLADPGNFLIGDKILSPEGVIDVGVLSNWASRSLHELSAIGKAIATSFYGEKPEYAYWTGCSTGGRQGYELAQRYPEDFQGILAVAPSLYTSSLVAAFAWGDMIVRSQRHRPSNCVLDYFRQASVEACDELDGVVDGVISDYDGCDFDPESLIGAKVVCTATSETITVTEKDVRVVATFHEGPKSPRGRQLWYAFPWGIDYSLMFSPVAPEAIGMPVVISRVQQDWIRYFIEKDPDYDISDLDTAEKLTDVFAVSNGEYGGIIGFDQPDLSGFRDAGGKLLSWHGAADEIIMLNQTLRYRKTVETVMGGARRTDDFYRLFVAPGVAHCQGGAGAFPAEDFDVLMRWVEEGQAPNELLATAVTGEGGKVTRKLCLWPKVARYDGVGDPDRAESYECAASFKS